MEYYVHEDRRRSVQDIADHVGASYATIRNILHDHLNMRWLCAARWVPHLLTPEEMKRRVEASQKFIRRSQRDAGFLDRIITCDETWLYMFDPETKNQLSQWNTTNQGTHGEERGQTHTYNQDLATMNFAVLPDVRN